MNIVILTNGTRGDIQPLVYLGEGLIRNDHKVTIVASNNFSELIKSSGLYHASMPVNFQERLETEEGRKWFKRLSKNPISMLIEIKKMIPSLAEQTLNSYWSECQGCDLIITTTGALGDVYISNALNIPIIEIQLQPLHPTKEFCHPLVNFKLNIPFINKLSYLLIEQMLWQIFKKSIYKWQLNKFNTVKKIKGGAFKYRRCLNNLKIGAYSSNILDKPSDWPERYKITGFLFPQTVNEPLMDKRISMFIENGSKPFYIGFGSMNLENPVKLIEILESVAEKLNIRFILSKGWSGFQGSYESNNLLIINEVSHLVLFPQMQGIIHHGGAGTTSASLLSGVPQMILSYTADQPFWSRLVNGNKKLHLAVNPNRLTEKRLIKIITLLSLSSEKDKASFLGDKIGNEKGLEKAVWLIEEALRNQ